MRVPEQSPTILLDELAALLGRPGAKGEAWLIRNFRKLRDENGFPDKLVTGFAWPRRLVEIWILAGENLPTHARGKGGAGPLAGAANDDEPGTDQVEGDPAATLIQEQHRYLTQRIGARR